MNIKLEKVYSFVQNFSEHVKKLGKHEYMSSSYRKYSSLESLNRIIEDYLEFAISKNPMDLVEPELLSEFYLKTSKFYSTEEGFTEAQHYFGNREIANDFETIKNLYGFLVMLTLEGSGFAPDSELYEELSFSVYWSQYRDLLGYIENREKIFNRISTFVSYIPSLANSIVELLSANSSPLVLSEPMKDAIKDSMYMTWTFSKKAQSMEYQTSYEENKKTFHNLNRSSKTRLLSALLRNYFSTNSFVGVARVMNFLDNAISFNTEGFSLNSDQISRSYLEKFLNLIIELKYSEYSKEELPQPSLTYILAISNGMSEGFTAISPNTEVVTEVFQEGGNLYTEFMYELFDIEDKYRDNSKTYSFNFLEGLDLSKILETEKGQKMFEVMMGICYGSVRTYREPVPGSVHLNFRNYSSVEDEDLDELLIPLREALIKVLDKVGSY